MTEDDPDNVVYYGLMKALYQHNPLRDSVAGTIESISQITADTLYNCHSVFYNPSNMALVVAGDVDPEKIVAIARKILPKEAGEVPQRDYGPEEKLVPETLRAEKEMEVSSPIFLIGSKAAPVKDGPDYLKQELTGSLALDILAGHSSPLYLKLYKEGLINGGFSAAYEASAGAAYIIAGGESSDPDKVFEAYKNEAKLLAEKGPDLLLFNRLKKAMTGRQLRSLNSFDNICYNYARGYFHGFDAYEAPAVLNKISPEDVTAFIRSSMAQERMAISVIKPTRTA
jgi:predicted Zn-dependent peptidase